MQTNQPEYYDILKKLRLEGPPIGVKFEFFRPEGLAQLETERPMSFCEMLRCAQREDRAFYFSRENPETCVGKILLGMEEMAPFAESGQIGARLGVFNEPRANQYFYQFVPKIERGVVNYVAFSPVGQINYRPDVLVIAAKPDQAEIVMRAATYSTGELYQSTCTPVMGCAWLMIHPFQTGKINFVLPAFVHGLHGRELFEPETVLIGIPHQWIPTVIGNMEEMTLELEGHESRAAYYSEFEGILADLGQRAQDP